MSPLSKQDQFNVTTKNIWQKEEITPYPWFTFLFFTLFSVHVKVAKLWKSYIQGYQVHARWCAIPVSVQIPRHIQNLRESFLFLPQNMNGPQISKGVLLFPKIYYILLSTLRMIIYHGWFYQPYEWMLFSRLMQACICSLYQHGVPVQGHWILVGNI